MVSMNDIPSTQIELDFEWKDGDDTAMTDKAYAEAIDMVLDVIANMKDSMNFHNPTLDELEQRIV